MDSNSRINPIKDCKQRFLLIYTLFIFILVISCNNTTNKPSGEKVSLPEEKNQVTVIVLEEAPFNKEIISNGKLSAAQKAGLYFKTQGIIKTINYQNGILINHGDIIATLETEELEHQIQEATLAFQKAAIDRTDKLLSMGYTEGNQEKAPEEHVKIANIRSGYNQAKLTLEKAKYQLQNAKLVAPFTGITEGITQKPFEKTNTAEPFCTLINNEWFYIRFPLLETEIGQVKTGQEVLILPVSELTTSIGNISEINPRIEKNGLAWLKAKVKNPGGYLEGMNVKVHINKTIKGQLVVPKQAVVLRQNREVLFRFTEGTAYWTYINILDENESSYSVEAAEGATLNAGDTVIISNNLNLAHESAVEVQ